MSRCLICYDELPEGVVSYHPACSRRLFGTTTPPTLDFDRGSISQLATEIIKSQTTLTGVQPKLSLDIDKGERGCRIGLPWWVYGGAISSSHRRTDIGTSLSWRM